MFFNEFNEYACYRQPVSPLVSSSVNEAILFIDVYFVHVYDSDLCIHYKSYIFMVISIISNHIANHFIPFLLQVLSITTTLTR